VLDRITARLAVLVCVGHARKGQLLSEEETRKRHLVNGPLGSLHDPIAEVAEALDHCDFKHAAIP